MLAAFRRGRFIASDGSPSRSRLALVGDEPAHVLGRQCAAGRARRRGRRAPGRRPVPVAALRIPSKTPPLRGQRGDCSRPARWSQTRSRSQRCGIAGQVDVAGATGEPHAEVVGEDEAGVAGLGRGEVDQPQPAQDRLGRSGRPPAGQPCGGRIIAAQVVSERSPCSRHVVHQALQPGPAPTARAGPRVCMNRPHWISARTSGRRPQQVDLPRAAAPPRPSRTTGETPARRRTRSGTAGRRCS